MAELAAERAKNAELSRTYESRYDCHGGPGTTEEACGACLTCVMRQRDESDNALAAEQEKTAKLEQKLATEVSEAFKARDAGAFDTVLAFAVAERDLTPDQALKLAEILNQQLAANGRPAGSFPMLKEARKAK